MKEKKKLRDVQVEELLNHRIIPYIYLFIVMAFFHIFCFEDYGDDVTVLENLCPTVWEEIKFIPSICNGWSGRYIINPFIHIMMHFDYRVWLVFELIFIMGMYNIIRKYGLSNDRVPCLYMLSSSMCTLTLLDYYEVGWRVVSITYIWVAIAAMVACLSIVKSYTDKSVKWYMWIVYLLLTMVAANKEEMSVMFVIIFTVAVVMLIKEKKQVLLVALQTVVCYISLFSHLFSSDNQARYETKMVVAARSHTFIDRAIIGVSTTFRHILFEYNLGFFCLAIVLVLVIWFSKKDIIPRLISLIPLVLWFMTWIPGEIDYMFGTNTTGGPRIVATIILGVIAVLAIVICFYYMYGFNWKFVWMSVVLIAGIAGRFVVGFGNSGWQRYERTYTFLYIVMIAITAIIASDVWDKLSYRKKQVLFGVIVTLGCVGIFKNILDLGVI